MGIYSLQLNLILNSVMLLKFVKIDYTEIMMKGIFHKNLKINMLNFFQFISLKEKEMDDTAIYYKFEYYFYNRYFNNNI